MKDIQFTVKQQKKEIRYILASLLLAVAVNVYAILSFGTEWKELHTQWFTVLVLAVFFYLVIALFRIIFWLVARINASRGKKTVNGKVECWGEV